MIVSGCGGGDDEPAETTSGAGGTVAVIEGIEDGEIGADELEQAIATDAAAQGEEPPAQASPDYDLVAGEALDGLIVARWAQAEAAEDGSAVGNELEEEWRPRTTCTTDLLSRFCANGELEAPPDIPPASG